VGVRGHGLKRCATRAFGWLEKGDYSSWSFGSPSVWGGLGKDVWPVRREDTYLSLEIFHVGAGGDTVTGVEDTFRKGLDGQPVERVVIGNYDREVSVM
jgi:hypothetical protein